MASDWRRTWPSVFTLAAGVAACSALFSIADGLLLSAPSGVAEPDTLFALVRSEGDTDGGFSLPEVETFRTAAVTPESIAAFGDRPIAIRVRGQSTRVRASFVTHDYFRTVGVDLSRGRGFTPADEGAGAGRVAVISDWLAREHELSRGDVLHANGVALTVIGVTPPGFRGTTFDRRELWLPAGLADVVAGVAGRPGRLLESDIPWLTVLVRLRPDVPVETARAEFASLAARVVRDEERMRADVRLQRRLGLHPADRRGLETSGTILFAAASVLLLVAVVNAAVLTLVRLEARRGLAAVAVALGARWQRLALEFVLEGLLLGIVAGMLGIPLGAALTRLVQAIAPAEALDLILAHTPVLSVRVCLFVLGLSMLVGTLSSLAPALRLARTPPLAALRTHGHTGSARTAGRIVMLETAIAFVLLVAAGLLLQSIGNLRALELGFDPAGVSIASVAPSQHRYDDARARELARFLADRAGTLEGFTFGRAAPVVSTAETSWGTRLSPAADDETVEVAAGCNVVAPNYFDVLRFPLVAGRAFQSGDRDGAPPVAIVNQTLARRLRADGNVLGLQIKLGEEAMSRTIVGIARDTYYQRLGSAATPYIYLPVLQEHPFPAEVLTLHISSRGSPAAAFDALQRMIEAFDPDLPLYNQRSLQAHVDDSLRRERTMSALVTSFAGLALLLTGMGVFAAAQHWVAERTREIGIRLALGAGWRRVTQQVLTDAVRRTAVAALAGAALAMPLGLVARNQLYGLHAIEWSVFGFAAGAVIVAAIAASMLPALRAGWMQPLEAIRYSE